MMTAIAIHPEVLRDVVAAALGDKARSVTVALGEVTVEVSAAQYLEAMQVLHTAPDCRFEVLVDLCGVDYSTYAEVGRSEEHTSELQSPCNLVCRLLLEKKKKRQRQHELHLAIS